MNANEVQSEIEARDDMRELSSAELDFIGGGSGGGVRPPPTVTA